MNNIKSVIPVAKLLPALHGLRGLAAVTVVMFHLHHLESLALPSALKFIGTHFGLGVRLFFVLSAFSLCYSTLPTICKPDWVRDYFIKRFFRVAPLFYVMLLIWQTFYYVKGVELKINDVFINILFGFNFVPGKHESMVAAGWTVGVEMIFYVIFPTIMLMVGRLRHAIYLFFTGVAISYLGHVSLKSGGEVLNNYASSAFISCAGVFFSGILAFWYFKFFEIKFNLPTGEQKRSKLHQIYFLFFCCVTFFIILSRFSLFLSMNARADMFLWAAFFSIIVVWQALYPSPVLASRFMEFLGERSYSIYLVHPFVIYWLKPFNQALNTQATAAIGSWAFLVNAFFTLLVVVSCAMLSYKLIEVSGINFGKRLILRLRKMETV
ncbi:MAG: acyltransferase [Pseudomonadota bacterium]